MKRTFSDRKRAILFSLYCLPFMLNLGIVEFLLPVKYDIVLDNLPLMGALITIAWIISTIFDFAIGNLTDKIGVRKTIQIGVVLGFVGSLLFGLSENFLVMTFGVFLWGFSFTFLAVPSEDYLLTKFKKKYTGTAYGIFFFFYDFAYAIAPLLAFAIYYFYGLNSTIIVGAVLVLLTFPLVSHLTKDKKTEGIEKATKEIFVKQNMFKKIFKDLKKLDKKEFSILVSMFILGVWFTIILMGSPLLFFKEEHSLLQGALLAFAFMIPFSFMEYFYGRWSDLEKNRKRMIYWGFLLGGLALIAFFLVQNFILMLLLAATTTIFTNMAWCATEVSISKYLPKGKKGEFTGIFITAKDLGFDLAPLAYGLIAFNGLKLPFLCLGVLLVFAWLFHLYASRSTKNV